MTEALLFQDWYVYALVDPRSGRPFYVGKGKNGRWLRTVGDARRGASGRNRLRRYILAMDDAGVKPLVSLMSCHFNEQEALDAEAHLIATLPGLTNKLPRGQVHVHKGFGRRASTRVLPSS